VIGPSTFWRLQGTAKELRKRQKKPNKRLSTSRAPTGGEEFYFAWGR
jgi:hypothetical protein